MELDELIRDFHTVIADGARHLKYLQAVLKGEDFPMKPPSLKCVMRARLPCFWHCWPCCSCGMSTQATAHHPVREVARKKFLLTHPAATMRSSCGDSPAAYLRSPSCSAVRCLSSRLSAADLFTPIPDRGTVRAGYFLREAKLTVADDDRRCPAVASQLCCHDNSRLCRPCSRWALCCSSRQRVRQMPLLVVSGVMIESYLYLLGGDGFRHYLC